MQVLGADPDSKTKEWGEGSSTGPPLFYRGEVGQLLKYFCYHKRMKWGTTTPAKERAALAASFKRLLARGYSPASVRRAVDRFYSTRTSQNHPNPALAFCSKKFQLDLFSGEVRDTPAVRRPVLSSPSGDNGRVYDPGQYLIEAEDHVLDFIKSGFRRDNDMILPWPPDLDGELRDGFLEPELYDLLLTYPDVVALILVGFDGSYKLSMMDVAVQQLEYLRGSRTASPARFKGVSKLLLLPKDFKVPAMVRKKHDTIEDAVNASG